MESDTPLIDHLVMREFVSGLPSYRSMQKTVRDRKPSLWESSWAVCGFRTGFFEKRQFFGRSFSCKRLKSTRRFLINHHMHMLRVYSHRRSRRSPRQVSAHGWPGWMKKETQHPWDTYHRGTKHLLSVSQCMFLWSPWGSNFLDLGVWNHLCCTPFDEVDCMYKVNHMYIYTHIYKYVYVYTYLYI